MTEEQLNNATVAGGVFVDVEFTGGETPAERVLVRELPVKEYPALLAAVEDDEARQAEIYCGKPKGWGDTIRPKSHNQIMEAGDAINKDAFFGWCARRINLARAQRKIVPDEVLAQMTKTAPASPSGSPASRPPAG